MMINIKKKEVSILLAILASLLLTQSAALLNKSNFC